MTNLYGKNHRELQDNFDSRKMADRLEDLIVKKSLMIVHVSSLNL